MPERRQPGKREAEGNDLPKAEFDDALRKMLNAPPAHKAAKKPSKKKPAKLAGFCL